MFYEPRLRNHGLKHDPFKALVVPRPIGWIGTVDAQGRPNLAPYSFFNGISDRPPLVYFSSAGHKDSLRNAQATGGFTCSLATSALRDPMNLSSAAVASGVDEFDRFLDRAVVVHADLGDDVGHTNAQRTGDDLAITDAHARLRFLAGWRRRRAGRWARRCR